MSAQSSIRDWNISRRIEPILLSEKKAPQPITRKVEVLLLSYRKLCFHTIKTLREDALLEEDPP